MSSHNNQQRRVARRFKRTMQAQQRHQRGHWVVQFSAGLAIGLVLLVLFVAGVTYCARHSDVTAPSTRIDWENVPVYPPTDYAMCDLRAHRPAQACITENQRVFARERKRQYAALAFERAR